MSADRSGKLLGTVQMVNDLRQRLARERLEIGIGSVLDLLFEQRCISLFDIRPAPSHSSDRTQHHDRPLAVLQSLHQALMPSALDRSRMSCRPARLLENDEQ